MKLKEIAMNTLAIIDAGYYVNKERQRVDIADDVRCAEEGTILYKPEDFDSVVEQYETGRDGQQKFETIYEVTGETAIEAIQRTSKMENDLLCLNFASAKNPGGGFMGGAQAQEESLARSSALYYCISQRSMMYIRNRQQKSCLYTDHMIYSPGVPFFKDDHGELMERPINVGMLTVPAVNAGVVKQQGSNEEVAQIDAVMLSRLEKLLTVAALQGHEVLILGAWGCGVFRNPVEKVSEYFRYQLRDNEKFKNVFRKVVFAVMDNTSEQAKIKAFREKFETK